MSLLHTKIGQELASTTIKHLNRSTINQAVFLSSIDYVLDDLEDLNVILFSVNEVFPAATLWIDCIKELRQKLNDRSYYRYVNYSQLGHGSVIIGNILQSMQTVIANELVHDAMHPLSMNIAPPTQFLIIYHKVLSRIKALMFEIHLAVEDVKTSVSIVLAQNEPYIMTKLAQLPAMRANSSDELRTIANESLEV